MPNKNLFPVMPAVASLIRAAAREAVPTVPPGLRRAIPISPAPGGPSPLKRACGIACGLIALLGCSSLPKSSPPTGPQSGGPSIQRSSSGEVPATGNATPDLSSRMDSIPDTPDELTRAAIRGETARVKAALEKGLSPDVSSSSQLTPSMAAAHRGHIETLRILVEAGADLRKTDGDGDNVMTYAISGGHVNVIRFLLSHGVEADIPIYHDMTPLFFATVRNENEIVSALLEAGAQVDFLHMGVTPLHIAARNGFDKVALLLAAKGASLKAKTPEGLTPEESARQAGFDELAEILASLEKTK